MDRPTITMARDLCRRLKARGVIILAIDGHHRHGAALAGASYGETKGECTALGKVLEAIVDNDEPPPWDGINEAMTRATRNAEKKHVAAKASAPAASKSHHAECDRAPDCNCPPGPPSPPGPVPDRVA